MAQIKSMYTAAMKVDAAETLMLRYLRHVAVVHTAAAVSTADSVKHQASPGFTGHCVLNLTAAAYCPPKQTKPPPKRLGEQGNKRTKLTSKSFVAPILPKVISGGLRT